MIRLSLICGPVFESDVQRKKVIKKMAANGFRPPKVAETQTDEMSKMVLKKFSFEKKFLNIFDL